MEPFSEDRSLTIAALGEKQLLKQIKQWLGEATPPTPYGMGDDCALLPINPQQSLITTDSLILNRHFTSDTDPDLAAAKLVKRNVSDIAAMGGKPTHAVIAGFLPANLKLEWLESFTKGLSRTALENNLHIVGGDLAESFQELAFNLTLLGSTSRPLLRSTGRVNDWICVTGELGGSILGKHLRFTPRVAEGLFLSDLPTVHACIDISDGIACDLPALVPSNCSAQINPEAIPLSEDATNLAQISGKSALWHAMNDGEDHELIFLISSSVDWDSFLRVWNRQNLAPVTRIGQISSFAGASLVDAATNKPFDDLIGYDHFK